MRNISALKKVPTAVFFLLSAAVCLPVGFADNAFENLGKTIIENYQETSKPLFETDESEVKEKLKEDPFFAKMRKKTQKFTKEEQETRRKFIEKVRSKDWTYEKRQKELAEFQKEALERRKKFIEKQQKKIQEHQEEEGS